jgi:hypothetical protein
MSFRDRKGPQGPQGSQWPLGWPLRHEIPQGYVIPSGNHSEWPLSPPGGLESLKSPEAPGLPKAPEAPEAPEEGHTHES